jgi:hypothetical protein
MKLTAVNQLWVADITYIRLREQFVYLAVVLCCPRRDAAALRRRGGKFLVEDLESKRHPLKCVGNHRRRTNR